MARPVNLHSAVEAKAGECRGLAMAMRAHADALGFWHGAERKVIEGWADALDAIAVGLVEAAHLRDMSRIRRFAGFAGVTAGLLLPSAVEGVASGIAQAVTDFVVAESNISDRARAVRHGLDDLEAMTYSFERTGVPTGSATPPNTDADTEPATVTATGSAQLGAATATATGQVAPGHGNAALDPLETGEQRNEAERLAFGDRPVKFDDQTVGFDDPIVFDSRLASDEGARRVGDLDEDDVPGWRPGDRTSFDDPPVPSELPAGAVAPRFRDSDASDWVHFTTDPDPSLPQDTDESSTTDARQIVRQIGIAEEHDEALNVADHVVEVADVQTESTISPVTLEVHTDEPSPGPS